MIHQLETIVAILGPIAAGSVYVLAKIQTPWRRFLDMLEDWHGDGPRPGVPSRPGVMLRLERLEIHGNETATTIEQLQKTDDETTATVTQLAKDVSEIRQHLGTIAGDIHP